MESPTTSALCWLAARAARLAMLSVAVAAVCAVGTQAASAKVVWLCKPGAHPDPCTPGLSTTVYSPTLNVLRVIHPQAVRKSEDRLLLRLSDGL